MTGLLQWEVSLGKIDIQIATMTIYSFRSIPRKSHLDITKQTYVLKMRYVIRRIRTEEPDFSALPEDPNTWDQSNY